METKRPFTLDVNNDIAIFIIRNACIAMFAFLVCGMTLILLFGGKPNNYCHDIVILLFSNAVGMPGALLALLVTVNHAPKPTGTAADPVAVTASPSAPLPVVETPTDADTDNPQAPETEQEDQPANDTANR